LGDGTTDSGNNTNRPEQIVASNVTAIAAGFASQPVSQERRQLWAMGFNNEGELGDGTGEHYIDQPEQIVSSNVTRLPPEKSIACFSRATAVCGPWVGTTDGQLGDGTASILTNQPEQIVSSNVTAIAARYYHSLFLKKRRQSVGYGF
jgi:alpha-tubulin suppressor-like RCC1 family protein